ncbi:MAG TPA: alternative ribosome rescue aminoacyl-tRNA hydrolase ArfB [Acidimicrobiia bacterium]|nr:alternative ribosome rescue aminoacyl-tRNA hydrolase ArfB [Acidimicrobiia bacterium]
MTGEGITVGQWLIPESELEERFDTPGGPGGQHANRNETAVTLRLHVAASSLPEEAKETLTRRLGPVVEAVATDTRSQWRNRALARERLVAKLERALVDRKPRKKTKPSKAARERRLAAKKVRGEVKQKRRPPESD